MSVFRRPSASGTWRTPIRIDSTNPDDPIGQLTVVLLALFGQTERTYAVERATHAGRSPPPRAGAPAGPAWSPKPNSPHAITGSRFSDILG